MTTLCSTYDSPVGPLLLSGDREALSGLRFGAQARPGWRRDDHRFSAERRQLDEYFAGERTEFDFPLRLAGGPRERWVPPTGATRSRSWCPATG
jgi:methylated-DNA-[protein]-cysteine S-methyltransferase